MESIFNNYRKFLLLEKSFIKENNDFSTENYNALINMPIPGYTGHETFVIKFDLGKEDVRNIIRNGKIPPLITNKIIKPAGAGRYGITYILDNDHIIKFFIDSHIGTGDDLEKFKKMHDRQFSGQAIKNEPAIYSYGKDDLYDIRFVEMGKVIPAEVWIEKYNLNYRQMDDFIDQVHYFLDEVNDGNFKLTKRDFDIFKNNDPDLWNELKVPQKVQDLLFKAILRYKRKNTHIDDLHLGNFGVLETKNPKEPFIFVFFDI